MANTLFILALLVYVGVHNNFAQDNKGFALYLLPPDAKAAGLSKLNIHQIKPKGKPFITAEDISWYLKDTHEVVLYYEAGMRLKKLKVPVNGRPFIVFSGDEPVYTGAFWNSFSTKSFKGVAINVSDLKGDFPVLKLDLDHPPVDEKHISFDPRPDARIFKALKDRSVLMEEVWMYGKCRQIQATLKRRASFIFTFEVTSVVKSNYSGNEVVFEIFDDTGKSLRSAVEAEWKRVDQRNIEWNINTQKEILLKFIRRVSDKFEDVYLSDFEIKN